MEATEFERALKAKGYINTPTGWRKRNETHNTPRRSKPEHNPQAELVRQVQTKKGNRVRRRVRYTSYRTRLLDPDNLAGGTKYFTDSLIRLGILEDDGPEYVELVFKQVKVEKLVNEYTMVEIENA